jgi:uncharacterized protein (TIGR01244 family)
MRVRPLIALLVAATATAGASAQQLRKQELAGAVNYTRVSPTIGCAGATTPDVIPALKQEGYASIINLRLATERGANVEGQKALAEAAGIRYIHLPFESASPDPAVIDAFLQAVADPANQPVFIHCASANRVGGLWLVKRVLQDGWATDKAIAEAEMIGLSSAPLKAFMLDYIRSQRR